MAKGNIIQTVPLQRQNDKLSGTSRTLNLANNQVKSVKYTCLGSRTHAVQHRPFPCSQSRLASFDVQMHDVRSVLATHCLPAAQTLLERFGRLCTQPLQQLLAVEVFSVCYYFGCKTQVYLAGPTRETVH